eukprot:COSAG01_NODE_9256_length_2501_cov_10.013739_2_plen_231_part_01
MLRNRGDVTIEAELANAHLLHGQAMIGRDQSRALLHLATAYVMFVKTGSMCGQLASLAAAVKGASKEPSRLPRGSRTKHLDVSNDGGPDLLSEFATNCKDKAQRLLDAYPVAQIASDAHSIIKTLTSLCVIVGQKGENVANDVYLNLRIEDTGCVFVDLLNVSFQRLQTQYDKMAESSLGLPDARHGKLLSSCDPVVRVIQSWCSAIGVSSVRKLIDISNQTIRANEKERR